MDLGLAGRRGIVAGASANIGRAVATALAREGAEIVMSARGGDRLRQAAAEIAEETGAAVTAIVADHSSVEGRAALVRACPEPDFLVTNCSPPRFTRDFREISVADWGAAFATTFVAPVELMRLVVDGMAARRFGRVVNVGTVGAKLPSEVRMLSGPARAALCNYSAALGRALARHNVAINTVLPGAFPPPGGHRHSPTPRREGEWLRSRVGWEIPADRYGEPDEIGALCALLCSRFAGYIVGQSLVIDGGMVPSTF